MLTFTLHRRPQFLPRFTMQKIEMKTYAFANFAVGTTLVTLPMQCYDAWMMNNEAVTGLKTCKLSLMTTNMSHWSARPRKIFGTSI